eukprot:jgi/Ulvmu1/6303/UM029_0010.1
MPNHSAQSAGDNYAECWSSSSTLPSRLLQCGHVTTHAAAQQFSCDSPCPVCSKPAPPFSENLHVRDYMPKASLLWNRPCTKRRILPERRNAQCIISYEAMLAQVSAGAQRLLLRGQRLRPRQYPQLADSFAVWRATPAGCNVQEGKIELPESGILLLTGQGVHFRKCTFSGGVVMCAGSGFSATFDECGFNWCTLCAVHGARVTLRRCSFRRSMPAVIANGPTTVTHFKYCLFHACITGVIAERGAAIVMQESRLLDTTTALIANGAGSHAELERTAVQVTDGADDAVHAVLAWGGGSMRMAQCEVTGACVGVQADGNGSTIEITGSSMTGLVRTVHVINAARASLRGTDLIMAAPSPPEHSQTGAGPGFVRDESAVEVGDNRSCDCCRGKGAVQLRQCMVRAVGASGLRVCDGGRADVALTTVVTPQDAVYVIGRASRMWLQGCKVRTVNLACRAVRMAGMLRIEDSSVVADVGECVICVESSLVVKGSKFCGGKTEQPASVVHVTYGKAAMVGCTVQGGVGGLRATASTIWLLDTHFEHLQRLGRENITTIVDGHRSSDIIAVGVVNCTFVMRNGSVRGHVHGVVASVDDDDAASVPVWLDCVRFEACAEAVFFSDTVKGVVRECHFTAGGGAGFGTSPEVADLFARPEGITFHECLGGTVKDCVFEGPWLAVAARSVQPVTVQGCEFRCPAQRDRPFVSVEAVAVVEGCKFSGGLAGVSVGGRGDATIRKCAFGPGGRAGVLLSPGGAGKVVDCTFRALPEAMHVQEEAKLAVQDCVCDQAGRGLVMFGGKSQVTAKRLTVHGANVGVLMLNGDGETLDGDLLRYCSDLKLVDCKMWGGRVSRSQDDTVTAGVSIQRSGSRATLLRCEIKGQEVGIDAQGSGTVKVRKSVVQGCRWGVAAGRGCKGRFSTCACCGGSAYDHASQEQQQEFWDDIEEMQQEGWPAQVVLEDVHVRECALVGVEVSVLGQVIAERVGVSGCGVTVVRSGHHTEYSRDGWPVGERSHFGNCWVTAGQEVKAMVVHQLRDRVGIEEETVHGVNVA